MLFKPYKAESDTQELIKFPDEYLTPNPPNHLSLEHDYLSIMCGINFKGVDYIRELLTPSFRVNHHFRPLKETLLHLSVALNKIDCVKYLFENRANVNSKNMNNQTPLHYAMIFKRTEIAEFLIGCGADITIEDINKNTPEILAYKMYKHTPKEIKEGFEDIYENTPEGLEDETHETIPKKIKDGFDLMHWNVIKNSDLINNNPEDSDESEDESYCDEMCDELMRRFASTSSAYKGFLF